jgi:uncharacterized membrane protein YiaA
MEDTIHRNYTPDCRHYSEKEMPENSKTMEKSTCWTQKMNAWQIVASLLWNISLWEAHLSVSDSGYGLFACLIAPNKSRRTTVFSRKNENVNEETDTCKKDGKNRMICQLKLLMIVIWAQFMFHICEMRVLIFTNSVEQSQSGESNRNSYILRFPRSL